MSGRDNAAMSRRALLPTIAVLLLAAGIAVVVARAPWAGAHTPTGRTTGPTMTTADCPGGFLPGQHRGDPVVCTHVDPAPPGVDVHEHVATAALKARIGAGLAAGSNVSCDGDGTSGYPVQALYVVEEGTPNRFAILNATFKLWAAGVDDTFNQSAAMSAGAAGPSR